MNVSRWVALCVMKHVMVMIVVCLVLFCVGGHFALFPNVIRQIYGK